MANNKIPTPDELVKRYEERLEPEVEKATAECIAHLEAHYDGSKQVGMTLRYSDSVCKLVQERFRRKGWSVRHEGRDGNNALYFTKQESYGCSQYDR